MQVIRPTLPEVVNILGLKSENGRFKHCGQSSETNAHFNGDHSFYCHSCNANGDIYDLLRSYSLEREQADTWLESRFHGYVRPVTSTVPAFYKEITPFVNLAHQLLLMDDPRIQEFRDTLLRKWGLTVDDIKRFRIGVAIIPMLQHLPDFTIQALTKLGAFNSNEFKLNRYFIFPEIDEGYCTYFQGRATSDEMPQKHWKSSYFSRVVFGKGLARQMLKNNPNNKPVVLVEGISDCYTGIKLGFVCVANLSAGSNIESIAKTVQDLYLKAGTAVIEFDSDAVSEAGIKGAERVASALCESGIDPVVTLTAPELYMEALPPELDTYKKLDISLLYALLGHDVCKRITEDKYKALLGLSSDWLPVEGMEPKTYLRSLIEKATNPAQISEVYRKLYQQPELIRNKYFNQITRFLKHNNTEIKKNLSAVQKIKRETRELGYTIVENGEGHAYYNKASQDYKICPQTKALYCTKSAFLNAEYLDENDEKQRKKLLSILTTKLEITSQGILPSVYEQKIIDPANLPDSGARNSNYPQEDLILGSDYSYWSNPYPDGVPDPYCFSKVASNFDKLQQDFNLAELYIDIYNKFKNSVFFIEPIYYHLCTLYVIMTYCFRMFDTIPYLHLHGVSGSGKTTALNILTDLCFRSVMTVSMSPASLYSIIHSYQPTVIFDEEDGKAEENKMSERDRELKPLLNQGYSKKGFTARVEKVANGQMSTVTFQVFSPKIFAGTRRFYDTLNNRCIKIKTRPASREERRQLQYRDPLHESLSCHLITNKLNFWSMAFAYEVMTHYQFLRTSDQFKDVAGNRYTDLFAPLLAILRAFKDPYDIEKDILVYLSAFKSELEIGMYTSSDYDILRILSTWHGNRVVKGETKSYPREGISSCTEFEMIIEKRSMVRYIKDIYLKENLTTLDVSSANGLIGRLSKLSVVKRGSIKKASEVEEMKACGFRAYQGATPMYEVIKVNMLEVDNLLNMLEMKELEREECQINTPE